MSDGSYAGINTKTDRIFDLTRLDDLKGIRAKHNKYTNILLNAFGISIVNFNSYKNYCIYGYAPLNFNPISNDMNYSRDIVRTNTMLANSSDENEYYKYAYHYPIPNSHWNKFSRFNLDYLEYLRGFNTSSYLSSIYTHDICSFFSIFDSINQCHLENRIIPKKVDKINYHGRNIYKSNDLLYLKITNGFNIDMTIGTHNYYKYVIVELDNNKYKRMVHLNRVFNKCTKHAYIVSNNDNKLYIDPKELLSWFRGTKFGDPSDNRTLLNLPSVGSIHALCSNSNVEDMSMHTISFGGNYPIFNMSYAFYSSKIKKLPKGLIESLSRGFSNLSLKEAFSDAKNIEIDISKINIPTLGSSPSNYDARGMYKESNCRHINRSIISTNEEDTILAEDMYSNTTLIEDSPLPDGMFKNYKNLSGMFKNVTFENTNTFKYIYGEFAKSANFTNSAREISFNNITINNNISNANYDNIIIGEGDDYEKTKLVSFSSLSNKVHLRKNSSIRLSIIGKRNPGDSNPIKVLARNCTELSFGHRHDDIKRAAEAGNVGEFAQYFIKEWDFLSNSPNGGGNSSEFFAAQTNTMGDIMFRRIAMLLPGDDYYRTHFYLFRGAAIIGLGIEPTSTDGYGMTSILYSNTKTSIDMLSLDEVVGGLRGHTWTKDLYNGCVVINTNGKNLKWTLSRYYYNTLASPTARYNISEIYLDYLTVFSNAIYLYRAINAQMYFTKDFRNEKIELIFHVYNDNTLENSIYALEKFLALMEVYHDPNDPKKPVGRFIMIHDDIYDSKTDMDKINALIAKEQDRRKRIDEFKNQIKNHTFDLYDDGFIFRGEV